CSYFPPVIHPVPPLHQPVGSGCISADAIYGYSGPPCGGSTRPNRPPTHPPRRPGRLAPGGSPVVGGVPGRGLPAGLFRGATEGVWFVDRYPMIAEHGLIGDLQTAALVAVDGTIDWFCCPRFDSPSLFGSILDSGL